MNTIGIVINTIGIGMNSIVIGMNSIGIGTNTILPSTMDKTVLLLFFCKDGFGIKLHTEYWYSIKKK